MDQARGKLLLVVDIASMALTITGALLSLVPFDFFVKQSINDPERRVDWSNLYQVSGDVGAAALFVGIALAGVAAYRRRTLPRMLVVAGLLLVLMILRVAIEGAVAIAIPAFVWAIVLGISGRDNQRYARRLVGSLLLLEPWLSCFLVTTCRSFSEGWADSVAMDRQKLSQQRTYSLASCRLRFSPSVLEYSVCLS